MWWWILTTLFFLIGVGLSALVYYSLNRINQYEEVILNLDKIINQSKEKLKIIDERGSFESDDEIGFFFEEVKNIQSTLDSLFEIEENNVEESIDGKEKK